MNLRKTTVAALSKDEQKKIPQAFMSKEDVFEYYSEHEKEYTNREDSFRALLVERAQSSQLKDVTLGNLIGHKIEHDNRSRLFRSDNEAKEFYVANHDKYTKGASRSDAMEIVSTLQATVIQRAKASQIKVTRNELENYRTAKPETLISEIGEAPLKLGKRR
jgi:hypothetical protein